MAAIRAEALAVAQADAGTSGDGVVGGDSVSSMKQELSSYALGLLFGY